MIKRGVLSLAAVLVSWESVGRKVNHPFPVGAASSVGARERSSCRACLNRLCSAAT